MKNQYLTLFITFTNKIFQEHLSCPSEKNGIRHAVLITFSYDTTLKPPLPVVQMQFVIIQAVRMTF